MTGADLPLLGRTVAHLQPAQVAHRARLRAQRTALQRWPQLGRRVLAGPDPCDAVGCRPGSGRWTRPGRWTCAGRWTWPAWPSCCRTGSRCCARPGHGRRGGEAAVAVPPALLGLGPGGQPGPGPRAGALRPAVAVMADVGHLWPPGRVASQPGGAARLVVVRATHRADRGSDPQPSFAAEFAAHAGFLLRHLATEVGENHLIKDLKALVGLAVFFADDRLLRRMLTRLSRQLTVQVLPEAAITSGRRPITVRCSRRQRLVPVAGQPYLHGMAG